MQERQRVFPITDPVLAAESERLFDTLMRHVACLNVEYVLIDKDGKESSEEYLQTISCFVITFQGLWFLATAGHAIQDLETDVAEGKKRILSWSLSDYFQKGAPYHVSTPFFIEENTRGYIYSREEVMDFSLIYLSPLFQQGMEANKIVPLKPNQCLPFDHSDIVKYIVVGFPESVVAELNQPVPRGERSLRYLAPTLVSARRITDLSAIPTNLDWPSGDKSFFAGKLEPDNPRGIVGMSGGPIFALFDHGNDKKGYGLVALQSAWYGQHRIILGTPATAFAKIADEAVWMKIETGRS